MHRREVGLGIATGLVLLLLAGTGPLEIGRVIGLYVLGLATTFWYVGVGAIILALVLQSRGTRPDVVGIIGLVGIAWVTFVGGAIAWLVIIFATSGPFGP